MKPPAEAIRLSKSDRDRLNKIKRNTGLESWNTICRLALLLGLHAREGAAISSHEKRDAIEIKWDTFAGRWADFYTGLILLSHSKLPKKLKISLSEFTHTRIEHGILIMSKAGVLDQPSKLKNLICD
jgi:DNA sulfur modification protein DndE